MIAGEHSDIPDFGTGIYMPSSLQKCILEYPKVKDAGCHNNDPAGDHFCEKSGIDVAVVMYLHNYRRSGKFHC